MQRPSSRRMSFLDRVIIDLDRGLKGLGGLADGAAQGRDNPAGEVPEAALTPAQRRHAAGLMRVDHTGEVAAQAGADGTYNSPARCHGTGCPGGGRSPALVQRAAR